MSRVKITLACGNYDRILPLRDGRVEPEGVDLNFLCMEPEELFWRMLNNLEFEASELSLGAYLIMQGTGDTRFVGIPVFPSRMFRHSTIFINTASGVDKPEEIKGKRIGVPDYTMTAPLWQRGLFEDFYGVRPCDVTWLTGGMNQPGRKQRIAFTPPPDVSLTEIGPEQTLSELLAAGEIDAIFTSRNPVCFNQGHPNVRRLWPDFMAAERGYYEKTGIFPIMHLIAVRRDVFEAYPWIALSLYKAFHQAKEICWNEMMNTTALKYSSPWYLAQLEEAVKLMGRDFWPYGVEENRAALEAVCRYAFTQGFTPALLKPEQLFAPATVEQYKI